MIEIKEVDVFRFDKIKCFMDRHHFDVAWTDPCLMLMRSSCELDRYGLIDVGTFYGYNEILNQKYDSVADIMPVITI